MNISIGNDEPERYYEWILWKNKQVKIRKKNMKVCVVGCGFVGTAVADFLDGYFHHQVIRVDPVKYKTKLEDVLNEADCFIICVNTPTVDGECDDSNVKDVLKILEAVPDKPVLLKSTVAPSKMAQYHDRVVYCPEFIRQDFAAGDFAKQAHIIIGNDYEEKISENFWWEFWSDLFPSAEIHQTNRQTACMIKYIHNAWLATKVAWFHELSLQLPKDVSYEQLTSILGQFKNIGPSHMTIPNSDGGLGYGGACFPKDVKALINEIDHKILKEVDKTNYYLSYINI